MGQGGYRQGDGDDMKRVVGQNDRWQDETGLRGVVGSRCRIS